MKIGHKERKDNCHSVLVYQPPIAVEGSSCL